MTAPATLTALPSTAHVRVMELLLADIPEPARRRQLAARIVEGYGDLIRDEIHEQYRDQLHAAQRRQHADLTDAVEVRRLINLLHADELHEGYAEDLDRATARVAALVRAPLAGGDR